MRSPRGTLQRAHVLLVAPKLGAVKGPASVLPASVLYGGQEGLKPLSFKMCAFQGEKPLTNRLLKSFRFYVPYVTLSVMTFPAIIEATQSPVAGAAAIIIGIILAFFGANLFIVAAACCTTVLLLELFLS